MMDKKAQNRNRMGTAPVARLLLGMAVPLMLSLLVQSLYNIVDSIYVSGLGQDALTATSLAYPVQLLMVALGVGTSVGINALLSRLLGQGKHAEVSSAAVTGVLLACASTLLFVLVGVFLVGPVSRAMTSDPQIASLCSDYLSIVTIFSLGCFMEMMVQRFLQASGRAGLSMVSLVVGAVTNIILDPIMIYGQYGCPALGIRGAAIATVIGQWLGALTALLLNTFADPDVRLTIKGYRLRASTVAAIYRVGLPTIVMQTMGAVMNFGVNALLADPTATAFFGIYYKLQTFVAMPMNGLAQACLPIIGFNFGAGNRDRVRQTLRTGILWAAAVGLFGTALFMIIPEQLLRLFHAGEELMALGVPAVRIMCGTYVLMAVTSILGMAGSGLGNGVINMLGASIRQVVLLLPCFALFKLLGGLDAAWWSFWIAEPAALLVSAVMMRRQLRRSLGEGLKDRG